jgi:monoamine oxidase
MPLQKRLVEAMAGAKKVHPDFDKHVPIELGLSIAWQNVPWQLGGWADDWSCDKTIPETLLNAEGRFWVAGDQVSYLSGWQEGAVRSAHHVIEGIAGLVTAKPKPKMMLRGTEPGASIRKAPGTKRRTRGLP